MRIIQIISFALFTSMLIAQEIEKTVEVDVDHETKKMIIIKKENGEEQVLKYDLDDEEAQKILKDLEGEGVFEIEKESEGHGSEMGNTTTSTRKRVIKRQRTLSTPKAKSDAYMGVIANPGETGTVIEDVIADSPAHNSGIKAGDVIVAINGARLKDYRSINRLISYFEADDKLDVQLMRDGKLTSVQLILAKRKGEIH